MSAVRLAWMLACWGILAGCKPKGDTGGGSGTAGAVGVAVTVSTDGAIAQVDPRFVSFAVDASQVAGTEFWAEPDAEDPEVYIDPYDFDRPALRPLAAALAPAMMRIGGTDADHLWYDTSGAVVEAPEGYRGVIDVPTWDRVVSFAEDTGLEVFFTLNAGPSARDDTDAWTGANAAEFMALVAERGDPVAAWELGNELNAFPLEFGLRVSGAQYGADLAVLADLRDATTPGIPILGPSVAYWPESGEIAPYMEEALRDGGAPLDVVTWHYYPQQSERCPVQSRLAEPETMLDASTLDEVHTWAAEVEALVAEHAPHADVWLGESGNAQCGGAPGVSDTWASTFWYLDQLGGLARRGQPLMVRQTLSGSEYGMIDDATLTPLPDYWGALLWRKTMGSTVLSATSEREDLRAYAHCHPDGGGAVSVLAINISADTTIQVGLAGVSSRSMRVHVLTADSLDSQVVRHNGDELSFGDDLVVPDLEPVVNPELSLPPRSIGVAVLPEADAQSCQ